jgi:hypothetical protein
MMKMKKYRIREGSPADWAIQLLSLIALILALNLPSTLENLGF